MKSLPRLSVENPVLVHMLMLSILMGGLYVGLTMVREMFPESRPNTIAISTVYPGATPLEVEKGVAIKIEEAIKTLEHIDKIESSIGEGTVRVVATLTSDVDDLDQAVTEPAWVHALRQSRRCEVGAPSVRRRVVAHRAARDLCEEL